MTENKKEKNLKNNNLAYIVELLFLSMASVFLSVAGATVFAEPMGLLCIVTASALFACVLFLTIPGAIVPAGIASFSITLAMGGSMASAAESLIYVIVGAIIYFGLKSKKKRTTITVGIASVLTVFFLLLIIFSVTLSTGRFSASTIIAAADRDLSDRVDNYIEQFYPILPQYSQYSSLPMDDAQMADLAAYKKELAINIKVMIPTIFMLYNLTIAYLSTALFKPAYNICIPLAYPGRKRIKNKHWRISISVVSAIIMTGSIFLMMII